MSGLMIKDIYTMWKETKGFMLLFVVILLFVRNDFLFSYAIFYAVMLPLAAFGYDERAKWNELANMFPYTAGEIVGSKYVMGCIYVIAAFLLGSVGRIVFSAEGFLSLEQWTVMLFTVCGALIVQAVYLPFLFWLGTEKGRIMMAFCVVVFLLGMMNVMEGLYVEMNLLTVIVPLAAVLGNLISFLASRRIYRRKIEMP